MYQLFRKIVNGSPDSRSTSSVALCSGCSGFVLWSAFAMLV